MRVDPGEDHAALHRVRLYWSPYRIPRPDPLYRIPCRDSRTGSLIGFLASWEELADGGDNQPHARPSRHGLGSLPVVPIADLQAHDTAGVARLRRLRLDAGHG